MTKGDLDFDFTVESRSDIEEYANAGSKVTFVSRKVAEGGNSLFIVISQYGQDQAAVEVSLEDFRAAWVAAEDASSSALLDAGLRKILEEG